MHFAQVTNAPEPASRLSRACFQLELLFMVSPLFLVSWGPNEGSITLTLPIYFFELNFFYVLFLVKR